MVDFGKVGPPPPRTSGYWCRAKDRGFVCTLPRFHTSAEHIAHDSDENVCHSWNALPQGHIISKWKNENEKEKSMTPSFIDRKSKKKPYRYPLWLNLLRFLVGQPWITYKAVPPAEEEPQKLLPPKKDTTTSCPPPGIGDTSKGEDYMSYRPKELVPMSVPLLPAHAAEAIKSGLLVLQNKDDGKIVYVSGFRNLDEAALRLHADALKQDGTITYLSEDVRRWAEKETLELPPPDPLAQLFQESVSEAEKARIAKEKAEEEYTKTEEFKAEFKRIIDILIKDTNRIDAGDNIYAWDLREMIAKRVIAWLNANGVKSSLCAPSTAVVADRKQFVKLMKKITETSR